MIFSPKLNENLIEAKFTSVNTHTGGEATRIVMSGFPRLTGETMIERKNFLIKNYDHYRTALMLEPRGHENMFGALLTEPVHNEADVGVIFMDTGGYLNMCGHGTIGTVTAIVETGIVKAQEPYTKVVLDAPAGIIETMARVKDGKVLDVTLTNVPSFLYKQNLSAHVAGVDVSYDISFGGSFFAMIDIDSLNITIEKENIERITEIGMALLEHINKNVAVSHPYLDITTVDLAEFYTYNAPKGADVKNVVIFGDSMADRSPCGTGCSAKLAQLYAKGKLALSTPIVSQSFTGSRFTGTIKEETTVGDFKAIIPCISGNANVISLDTYIICKEDNLKYGFSVK